MCRVSALCENVTFLPVYGCLSSGAELEIKVRNVLVGVKYETVCE